MSRGPLYQWKTTLSGPCFTARSRASCQEPRPWTEAGLKPDEVVRDVMMGKSRIKEMMAPIDVANLFLFGFSRYSRYLIGGDLLFDGGAVLTY